MNAKFLAAAAVVVVVIVAVGAYAAVNMGDDDDGRITRGVIYHGNGGTNDGSDIFQLTNDRVFRNVFTYSGMVFTGWNTSADGSGTDYAVGVKIDYGSGTVDLYAQWAYALTGNTSITTGDISSYLSFAYYGDAVGDTAQSYDFDFNGLSYALPTSMNISGIAVIINSDSPYTWGYEDGAIIATGENNQYRITIEFDGAEDVEFRTTSSDRVYGWIFAFSGPVSCSLHISLIH